MSRMAPYTWQDHTLRTSELELAWYEIGTGRTLVLLNGGPGDDHRYLRPVAESLADAFLTAE